MRLEYDEACKMMRRAVQLGGELPWVQQVCVCVCVSGWMGVFVRVRVHMYAYIHTYTYVLLASIL